MKIFSTEQLKEADRVTVEKQGITSDELMERAAKKVFSHIHHQLNGKDVSIRIFCGIGNNGGDGLVIARLLTEHGYDVTVYIVNYSNQRSKDFLINYDRLKVISKQWPVQLKSKDDFPELQRQDFVVDAVFGIGLNRPPEDWVASLIRHINKSGAFILSVDMPSGLFAEQPTPDKSVIIRANQTLTFQAPKLVFYLPETAEFAGDIGVIDIGLDPGFLNSTATGTYLIGPDEARGIYKPRKRFTHKGTFGHALVVGGSYGKMGSISLTATAALRAGAGMVTIFAPSCGYTMLQTVLPEAMVISDKTENFLSDIDYDLEASVISFGVGVGKRDETRDAFKALLDKVEKPMVIDADGLNLLAYNPELLEKIPRGSVLTPHPKELERLIGEWGDDFEKLAKAKAFVKENEVILVIKGSYTITVSSENIYVNTSGNPGMATAGSGDVLTGVITGLVSQQYDSLTATVFGIYLHGRAGDLAAENLSYEGMLAGDIAANLGKAYMELKNYKTS